MAQVASELISITNNQKLADSKYIQDLGLGDKKQSDINKDSLSGGVYNVTKLHPLQSGYYTITTAIEAVPQALRCVGMVITYQTASDSWETKQFKGALSDWGDSSKWEDFGGGEAGDGVYDISAAYPNASPFASLQDALTAFTDTTKKKPGMTIKYLDTDGKYHQYRYMLATTESGFTNTKNWKVVGDATKEEIDAIVNDIYVDNGNLSLGNEISCVINSAGKWVQGLGNSYHYLIQISPNDRVKVVANDNNLAVCAWFTSNETPVVNESAPISQVDSSRFIIAVGESEILTAPSDAKYLYVQGVYNGNTFTPQSIIIVDKLADIVAETKDSIESITKASASDLSKNIIWIVGVLDVDGNIGESESRAYSNLIKSNNEVTAIAKEGYQIRAVCYYDDNEDFEERDWFTSPADTYVVKHDGYVRFIVGKADNSSIAAYEPSLNIRIYRADENGLTIIDDISSKKVEYHEVQPYFETGMMVSLAGNISENTYNNHPYRRLLWYPLKKGDTVRIVITFEDGVSINGRISFFNNESPSLGLECYSGYYYNTSNGVVEYTYTAPVDGFIGFTYVDTVHVDARILVHLGEDAKLGNLFIPKIGCGTQIVSRVEDTYCHSPMIRMNDNYIFVTYQGSNVITGEPFARQSIADLAYQVLLVYNRKTGRSKYITIFDNARPDYIDGNKCTVYYNGTCIILNETNTLLIKIGCQCNGKWIRIYKTYNADTDTLSAAAMQQIKYNNTTYDLNLRNYITMVNTLYNTSFALVDIRQSNEITDMCYYDGKYYCVMALACHNKTNVSERKIYAPHVFCKSDDAITWEPIANITPDTSGNYSYYSAETLLEIVEGIVYHVFRSDRLGEFYMVFSLNGTVLKGPQPTNNPLSKVWSKPAITVVGGRVIIGYNIVHDDSLPEPTDDLRMKYAPRTKMRLAEISQDNYELTELKTYFSSYGWNYYHFAGSEKGKIIGVNVEDSRDFNDGYNSPTSDVNIYEIDVNELLFEQEQESDAKAAFKVQIKEETMSEVEEAMSELKEEIMSELQEQS